MHKDDHAKKTGNFRHRSSPLYLPSYRLETRHALGFEDLHGVGFELIVAACLPVGRAKPSPQ
jgi:hypothetical protein